MALMDKFLNFMRLNDEEDDATGYGCSGGGENIS